MINTIIIDEKQECINRLLNLLEIYRETFNVLAVCKTVEEAITITEKLNPDLVFLDIKINDKTAFDYLTQLSNVNFEVVFTTNLEKCAIKAFKFNVLDYLLKPIDTKSFKETVSKIKQKISKNNLEKQMVNMFSNMNSLDAQKRISIPTQNGFTFLKISQIIYCEADSSYTHIYTKKKKLLVSKPLKYYENLLEKSPFFRVHNSFLININLIKKYTKGKGGYVTMINDVNIDVSTRRKEAFLKYIT